MTWVFRFRQFCSLRRRPDSVLIHRQVTIEQGTINTPSYLEIHWYLREHEKDRREAITDLRRMYPDAPLGLPVVDNHHVRLD